MYYTWPIFGWDFRFFYRKVSQADFQVSGSRTLRKWDNCLYSVTQSIGQPRMNDSNHPLLSATKDGKIEIVKQEIESYGKSFDEIQDDCGR